MASLLALLVLAQMPGGMRLDPGLHWYTLQTRHFAVHFSGPGRPDQNSLELPRAVAAIAEEVHATLCPRANWTPKARTNVIVADFFDYSNGWASPFPENTITIIPTVPAADRTNDDNWLRTVILHEYSHILETDMVSGVPALLRRVFGRVGVPNALAPAWLHEGYAVWCETRYSGFGRLRGTEYDMAIRAAADSRQLLGPDRCSNYELRRWPSGSSSYLYGSRFFADLAATDSTAPHRYNQVRSGSLPFFENATSRRAFGRSVGAVWQEWQQAAIGRAAAYRALLGPLTPLRRLTGEGFATAAPCFSGSGSEVYYVSRTGKEYPAIKAVDTATGRTRVLHRGPLNPGLSLSRDGRWLVFSEQHRYRDYYEYDDLFWLDLKTMTLCRLTRGQRARDPDFAPDTTLIVYVANRRGRNELRVLDYRSGSSSTIYAPTDRTALTRPRYSPSGKWLALGMRRPGGWTDIELIDTRTGWTIPVTNDRYTDLSPCWSRTGRFLFFASNRPSTAASANSHPASCTLHLASCTLHLAPCTPHPAPCTLHLAPCTPHPAPCTLHLASCTPHPAPCTLHLASCTPHPAPCTLHLAPCTPHPASSSLLPPPSSSFNLFAYQLSTGKTWQVTNALYGLFEPAVAPDNRTIAATGYSVDGDDICLLPLDARLWTEAVPVTDTAPEIEYPDTAVASELYYYSPFPALLPGFWLPWYDRAPAVLTMGWDPLQLHLYSLVAGWRIGGATPFLSAGYVYRGLWPQLSAALDADRLSQRLLLGSSLTFAGTFRTHWLDASAALDHSDELATRLDLDWTLSDAFHYRFSVAPEQGRTTGLHLDVRPGAASRFRPLAFYTHYFGAPPHAWSLRCRLAAGTAFGDSLAATAWSVVRSGLLGVRGYTSDSRPGRTIICAGTQFRLPLVWVERGISTGPLFLSNVNAALFAEAGLAAAGLLPVAADLGRTRVGTGAELRADFVVGHLVPVSATAGIGVGLSPAALARLYFELSSSLLGSLLAGADPDRRLFQHLPEP